MGALNVMELKLKHSRWVMRSHGLEARLLQLDNGSCIHCWLPAPWPRPADASTRPLKPPLLLLHGFGADGTLGWERQVPSFANQYSLFIPDLLFFGQSMTTNKQRSEIFQAECMFAMMEKLGVGECVVCGHSYGGFVAYRMAHLYPSYIKRVIIISSGILMDATTSNIPLLETFGASTIEEILIPHDVLDFKKGLSFIFHKIPWLPSFVIKDMFALFSGDRQRRHELMDGIILGKKNAPPLPKINQDVLIIWGDHDQVFNLDLAYSLKEFLGDHVALTVINEVGHMPQMENSRDVNKSILEFLSS
ncbi:hypothetical protein GOP47_0011355 [Adiantum capillus-veneris]|uniref:AB hydrolase-1 domain-containing protein n=1 Tax=Adiantum capillus-veneris TaxID=13818 RepID=A0A9D4ZGN1_ADICA|nr:hypothetical protein GOP47_0011355 [Adiantum capillus-veneris]